MMGCMNVTVEQTNPPTMAVLVGGMVTVSLNRADDRSDRWDLITATTKGTTIDIGVITGVVGGGIPDAPVGVQVLASVHVLCLGCGIWQGSIWPGMVPYDWFFCV